MLQVKVFFPNDKIDGKINITDVAVSVDDTVTIMFDESVGGMKCYTINKIGSIKDILHDFFKDFGALFFEIDNVQYPISNDTMEVVFYMDNHYPIDTMIDIKIGDDIIHSMPLKDLDDAFIKTVKSDFEF